MTMKPTCAIALAAALGSSGAWAQGTAPTQSDGKPAKAKTGSEQQVVGRDWTAIDTNKDGYISPEEMEVWLKANPGPQK